MSSGATTPRAPKLVTIPEVVIRPIPVRPPAAVPTVVNHSAPSGPVVMALAIPMLGLGKMVTVPVVVIRLIAPVSPSSPSVNTGLRPDRR
jgi:hypothetical protein